MPEGFSVARRRFWVINYVVLLAFIIYIATLDPGRSSLGFMLAAAVGYSFTFMLPLMCLSWLLKHLPGGRWLASCVAVVGMAALLVFFYGDSIIYQMYGYHFNGFVWNLVTTPGGLASLESSDATYLTVALVCTAIFVGELLLFWALAHFAGPFQTKRPRWLTVAIVVIVFAMAGERVAFGISHFFSYRPVLTAANGIPFYLQTTFSTLLMDMGYKPARNQDFKIGHAKQYSRLHYPLNPIKLQNNAPSPNIVWLVAESLRWDMLTPEIMPHVWKFAQNNWRYTDHYSGGSGTRWGIFSLFYGLPAHYWFDFLDARRPPALVTTLQKKDYKFGLYTSAKFTYPEFDKTVWASLPSSELHEYNKHKGWVDDKQNVKRLNHFINKQHSKKNPFLAFMFFETTHARYFFPKQAIIRKHYLKNFNYITTDVKNNIQLIKNRYINSAHWLDKQMGRVLDNLKKQGLLKNTIVIITGDHGEEFMEHGKWGHNSTFHNQQMHTPFVLHVPGTGPRVVNAPTSHLDVVPTLMPLLGVTNPPSDYSVDAIDLLTPTKNRFRVVGSWNAVGYVGNHYKVGIPLNPGGAGYKQTTDANDNPVADPDAVMKKVQPQLTQMLHDLSVFYRK